MVTARILAVLLLFAPSCKEANDAKDTTSAAYAAPPPNISVSKARKDLVFSYPTADGFGTSDSVDGVPADARAQVVVTDLSLSPAERQADKYIYLADLSAPRADGTYPVALASRYGFEATRTASVTEVAAAGGVVIYTTAWCGVCKKAKRLLSKWSVPFEEKDIEGSKRAAQELAAKAQAAGINPGGVPVIDVAGTLLQGLDEATLQSALTSKGFM